MAQDKFIPELGQMMFGQPTQTYAVPDIWEAALEMLGHEVWRVENNRGNQDANPMSNSGHRFDCDKFSAHAYSWDDEEDQPWNFKWRDVRISWYKYCGRGMSANMDLTPDMASEMLIECLAATRALDVE